MAPLRRLASLHLASFVAMIETGSISQAARKLHVTQSTLSKRIRALEQEVGLILLDRNSRPLRPSAAGEQLLSFAAQVTLLQDELLLRLAADAPLVAQTTVSVEASLPQRIDLAAALALVERLREMLHAARLIAVADQAVNR